MVFGGTAARSSAVPTPSEGMVTYLSDLNDIQAYDGSNWISTGLTAGTTTANYGWPIPASGSIASLGTAIDTTVAGLSSGADTVLASGTVTTQSTINLTNVLSDTYQFYNLKVTAVGSTSASLNLRCRENTTDKTTNYYVAGASANQSGVMNAFNQGTNVANFYITNMKAGEHCFANVEIYRPDGTYCAAIADSLDYQNGVRSIMAMFQENITNFTGFTISASTGTFSGHYILTGRK